MKILQNSALMQNNKSNALVLMTKINIQNVQYLLTMLKSMLKYSVSPPAPKKKTTSNKLFLCRCVDAVKHPQIKLENIWVMVAFFFSFTGHNSKHNIMSSESFMHVKITWIVNWTNNYSLHGSEEGIVFFSYLTDNTILALTYSYGKQNCYKMHIILCKKVWHSRAKQTLFLESASQLVRNKYWISFSRVVYELW